MDKAVVVMSIYRSPLSTMMNLLRTRSVYKKNRYSDHLIVTDDFNIDLFALSPERDTMMTYFSNKGMMQALSGVSSNCGSQLDCILTKNLICSYSF